MNLLNDLKIRALLLAEYLGDAAHRRAVVGLVLMLGNHFLGWSQDETVIVATDTALALLLAAWSSRTPKIDVQDAK